MASWAEAVLEVRYANVSDRDRDIWLAFCLRSRCLASRRHIARLERHRFPAQDGRLIRAKFLHSRALLPFALPSAYLQCAEGPRQPVDSVVMQARPDHLQEHRHVARLQSTVPADL